MKEIDFYINDVRLATDNTDTNGVKDREIVRYFNDGVRAIQALIFKNNPLCSYFQKSVEFTPITGTREYDLPSDCYAKNAVARVEVKNETGRWVTLGRVWPEDCFFGWYTSNGQLILSGNEETSYHETIRVWYFYRIPKVSQKILTLSGLSGFTLTTSGSMPGALLPELAKQDNKFSIVNKFGVVAQTDLTYASFNGLNQVFIDTTLSSFLASLLALNYAVAANRHWLVWGNNSTFIIDLPEEVETFLVDYVAKRIYGRNNYGTETSKIEFFSNEAKTELISIFADAAQTSNVPPLTDTDYLRL